MFENLKDYKIILASQSPRRKELFTGLNIPFEVASIDVNESYDKELIRGVDIPCFLAKKKADACQLQEDTLLITADTVVWHNEEVLGKPRDREDAKRMLCTLSGNTHEVITGVSIKTKKKQKTFSVVSKVRFAKLEEEEIDFYIDKYKPYDKAGAYGVQEWIGYIAVEYIEGSFYNIMGLPIQRLYFELKKW